LPERCLLPAACSQSQGLLLDQVLGPDMALLQRLDRAAEAGPAAAAAAAEGHASQQQQQGSSAAAAAAAGAGDAGGLTVKQEPGQHQADMAVKQEDLMQQQQQHESCLEPSLWRPHTLRSFAAYTDWAKRMHFSSQPCNAELQPVSQPGAAAGGQRRSSATGLPPAKRLKHDPEHPLRQPSRDTGGTEHEGTEDTDLDTAAESSRDGLQQQQPERHSSRLQAKGRAPLHPLKAVVAGSGGRGTSPEPAAAVSKVKAGGKAATSTTSATPPTTPRTKAVKSGSGSRLIGAAAGMLGLAAVQPDSAISLDQFEAEFWRIVEQQQPGRLFEALAVPELRSSSSSGGSIIQELQEQQAWGFDEQYQLQQQQQEAQEACCWDLSSLPARRDNLLRYLPLQRAIPGLTEPTLGLSSCLSSSCWQVMPQGLYGISCLHTGAPRVSGGTDSLIPQTSKGRTDDEPNLLSWAVHLQFAASLICV
jgi:hypothetical protein